MKRFVLWMTAAILFCGYTCNVQAQEEKEQAEPYFTTTEMPDLLKWLPAPPDTLGEAFAHDIMRYMWGKAQRLDPVRADIAVRDAVWSVDCIMREFSEPFGLQMSKEGTPEIYKLLLDASATCDNICVLPKEYYMRKRPFMRMQEQSLTPDDEEALSKNGSYPSGHTILGWSSALLLSEINPERADTLLARGMMYGDSRVIVGAHWQSDVDAGRLAASAAYAKLHTSKRFLKQLAKAQAEFIKKSKDAR
ncbi:MAG: phosphatase PAP2 family protein [Bacteroidaceae bacterium]|nr:phosphatase PAP2 family protein [Bacteroidaceae bacterium]